MTDSKFVCNARFVGRSVVDGPLNDYRLSDVVNTLQEQSRAKKSQVTLFFWYGFKTDYYLLDQNQFRAKLKDYVSYCIIDNLEIRNQNHILKLVLLAPANGQSGLQNQN